MGDESSIINIGPVPVNKIGYASWDEKGHNNIVQIFISHGKVDGINSIQFQYAENGGLVLSQKHGANGGNKFDAVKLDYPKEYISWIAGQGNRYPSCSLRSITFGTNYGEYGPFGGPISAQSDDFCFKLGQSRQFHGFHGTADNNGVTAIGVYLKPIMTLDVSLNTNVVNVL